jgi:hypothetical protein
MFELRPLLPYYYHLFLWYVQLLVSVGLVMAWLLGPLLFICGAGGKILSETGENMGREDGGY